MIQAIPSWIWVCPTPAKLATNAAESATVSRSGYSVRSVTRMAARPRMIITNRKRAIDTFPKLVSLNTDQSVSQSSTPLSVPAILATTHANQKPPLSSAANATDELLVAAGASPAQADRMRVQSRYRAGRGICRKESAPPRSVGNERKRLPLRPSTFNPERVLTLHAVSILGYDMPVDRIASRIQGRSDRHEETLLILGVYHRHAGCDCFPALVLEFQA